MKGKIYFIGLLLVVGIKPYLASAETLTPIGDNKCAENNAKIKSTLSNNEYKELVDLAFQMNLNGVIRYMVDRDSILIDYKKSAGETNLIKMLDNTKSKLDKDQVEYWSSYVNYKEPAVVSKKGELIEKLPALKDLFPTYIQCTTTALYKHGNGLDKIIDGMAKASFRSGRFDKFQISVKGCSVGSTVGTGNSYTEPDQWPGSRFVVIDALFKNIDTEGRLPFEGSLIIKTDDGRILNYDNTETVMEKGYGIYFKSVNPLVTMPTKIVYRIPDDISGEVLWQPGRNPEGKSLWCAFVTPNS